MEFSLVFVYDIDDRNLNNYFAYLVVYLELNKFALQKVLLK